MLLNLKCQRFYLCRCRNHNLLVFFTLMTAMAIIEEELGAPIAGIFDQFDYEPIAAASLGQVHRAKLRGQEVVIKVRRPGLKGLFDIDLKNLRVIAEYLQKN
ncbi:unnamed protein product [Vicia faba]|uniref:ABC1 atypical kinase-like domain-containing protein n=1 Tax=Vicia faba TaxID=3906 RepID=A0AAV0ZSL2_VICFA|nr:unnamed protein product [Vicia faba]